MIFYLMKKESSHGPARIFDLDNRYESISKLGDPLEVLDQAIGWETFRPVLSKALRKFKKTNAGRKPYDSVFMFKIPVLQSLYNLSDDQTEFRSKIVYRSCVFWVSISKTRCQMRKPFGCSAIHSQTKMLSINCSADSIDISTTKVCLHVRGNSLMPALSRFLYNATLAKKILVSNKVKFRKTGKSNHISFNRRIRMHVG